MLGRLLIGEMPVFAGTDGHHVEVVARRSSFARLVLAVVVLLADFLEVPHPASLQAVHIALLPSFVLYSAAILGLAVVRPALVYRLAPVLHVLDFGWTVTVTGTTGGVNSPFVVLFVFGMAGAGYRWGLRATLLTTGAAMAALVAQANATWLGHAAAEPREIVLHTMYLGLGGAFIALLAEEAHRQRRQATAVARILGRVKIEAGLAASVRAVFDDLLVEFGGRRALLLLEEEGSDRVLVWTAEPREGPGLSVRLTREPSAACGTYLFALPPALEVLRIGRTASPAGDPVATGLDAGGRRHAAEVNARPLLGTPFQWQTALVAARLAGQGWTGRLFVFDPRAGRNTQLRFLQIVVRQVGPALFNLYLQRRLRSRAGVADRIRVSRELHDGVIQSLIGLQMELEVFRREAEPRLPESTRANLAAIESRLADEILDVRDLMQALRPVEVEPGRFVEHVAEILDRFRHRTGIMVRLSSEVDHVDCPPPICIELSAIVQEALANIRKHSGASNVLVRLARAGAGWLLAIDDDGRGLDFEGRLTGEELDRQRRGPVMIRERVRGFGGDLAIDSTPGRGTRLEITIPRAEPS